jgi:hypothetical protein
MWDISLLNTPELVAFFQDFSQYLFFLLHVIISLQLLNIILKVTSHKKDD